MPLIYCDKPYYLPKSNAVSLLNIYTYRYLTPIRSTTISKYDYTNDDLGRRTAMGKSGTAFTQADTIAYGYDGKSEVTSAVAQNQNTFNYGFSFDPIGNRLTSTTTETGTPITNNYTTNNLNQYSLINDGAPKTPAYDFDGNMTGDGNGWTYTWDAENRLVAAEKTGQRLEFKYDFAGRRVEKKVIDGGSTTSNLRFVYDGFKQIERLNALDSNAIVQKFVCSGRRMLSMADSNGIYYYSQDANKNISELLASDGTVKAHYEYSPFGKTVVSNGDLASENPFRFSSEYADDETGLVYYNFRYYDSEAGRWLSRDPIEEEGGWNLYGMLWNDPINWWDYLGLDAITVGGFTIFFNEGNLTEGEKEADRAHEKQHRDDSGKDIPAWQKEQRGHTAAVTSLRRHIKELNEKKRKCGCLSPDEQKDLEASEKAEKVSEDIAIDPQAAKDYWNTSARRWYQKEAK